MRITSVVLMFLIVSNGAVTIMTASGLAANMGVELAPGVEDATEELIANLEEGFSPGGGLGDTLFGLFAAGGSFFALLAESTHAIPQMFLNLGFPPWFVFPAFAPMYLVAVLDVIYAFTQRAL